MKQTLATNPLPNPFDWNDNIKWIETLIGALIGWITFIILYFKHKSKEKEEFIVNVVRVAVAETLGSQLKDIKDDIKVLFKYRDEDRNHADDLFKEHRDRSDDQFKELLKEIKK